VCETGSLLTFVVLQSVQLTFLHQRLGLLHEGDHPSEGRRQDLLDELLEEEQEEEEQEEQEEEEQEEDNLW